MTLDQLNALPSAQPSPQKTGLTLDQLKSYGSPSTTSSANQPQPLTDLQNIRQSYQSGKINAADVVIQGLGEGAKQTTDALNSPLSPIGWVSRGIGGLSSLLGRGITAVADPVGKYIGSSLRNAVGSANADKVGQKIQQVASSPIAQGLLKTYTSPQVSGDLKAVGSIAGLAGTVVGSAETAEGLESIGNKITPPATASELTGKITQATGSNIPVAQRALNSVDTSGVKNFSDLSGKLQNAIDKNTSAVDESLGKYTETYKPNQLNQSIPVRGGDPIISNPVNDSLKQLGDYYESTNDPDGVARIKSLQAKYQEEGLTPKEINDIAREHGNALNAYNANNELASGLKRQAAENTRMGVKTTVRNLTPAEDTQSPDKNTSDLIKTKGMIDDMSEKVQKLENRLNKAGVAQKIGRLAGSAVGFLDGGFTKGLFRRIVEWGPDGGTTMNPIQLQQSLGKNLSLLDSLMRMKPSDAITVIEGMSAPEVPALLRGANEVNNKNGGG